MLLRGGELDGVRLLGPRTVAYMTRNHLPGGADLETFGRPIFAESAFRGVGFGLGFSMVVDAAAGKVLTSPGEYAWGGMASTAFYVDPVEEVTAMFFTQFLPSSTYPIRSAAARAGRPGAGGLMSLTFALVRVAIVAVALWVATTVVPGIGISGSSTGCRSGR